MQVILKVEGVKEAAEYFRAVGNRNLPITMAATLSRVVALAQKQIRNVTLPQHFILRRAAWARSGIRIEPATKSNWVASVKDINPYMAAQETGGPKLHYGRFIAVPLSGARSSPGALIAPQNRPHAVMQNGGFIRDHVMYAVKIRAKRGRERGYIGRVIPMYALVEEAIDKPRYEFEPTVEKVVEDNYRGEFKKAWEEFDK